MFMTIEDDVVYKGIWSRTRACAGNVGWLCVAGAMHR